MYISIVFFRYYIRSLYVVDKIWAGDLYGRLQWRADRRAIVLYYKVLLCESVQICIKS